MIHKVWYWIGETSKKTGIPQHKLRWFAERYPGMVKRSQGNMRRFNYEFILKLIHK